MKKKERKKKITNQNQREEKQIKKKNVEKVPKKQMWERIKEILKKFKNQKNRNNSKKAFLWHNSQEFVLCLRIISLATSIDDGCH